MVVESIRRPLLRALVAGVLVTALTSGWLIGRLFERTTEQAAATSLRAAQGMFRALERGDVRKMDAALVALLEDRELRRLYRAGDRAGLLRAAQPRFEELRSRDAITHWYFIGPDRRVVLRVHRPDLHGDEVARLTLDRAVATRDLGAGLELGQTAFALRVVRPWVVDGELLGYLELAEEIGHFLVRLKGETGNDFALIVEKRYLDEAAWAHVIGSARNTWNARPEVVVVDTTAFDEGLVDWPGGVAALPDEGLVLPEEHRDGRTWLRSFFPVLDAAGRKVGALAVLHDFTAIHQALAAGRRLVLLVLLGASILACAGIWWALERHALRPLANALEEGERAAGLAPPPGADELGRLRALVAWWRGRGRP